jgi:Cu2+-containing amine oxidase
MIHTYGTGRPQHLFDLIDHHAAGVGDLIAPLAVVILDVLGRDARQHDVHFGKGWNSVSLYLENGERVAIRARQTGKVYDHVDVHRGSVRPLGPVVLVIRTARDVARFDRELKKWLALPRLTP